jgi:hypothetical protein
MKFLQLADIDDSTLLDTHSNSTDAYFLYCVDEHLL